MFKSSGKLVYSELPSIRLVVEIDSEISAFYRSLIPPHIHYSIPMYPPHISVVRREVPPNMTFWNKYQNFEVGFSYDPYIFIGSLYIWLKVYSERMEEIREELGLPRHRLITRSTDEQPCFHTTIANFKNR